MSKKEDFKKFISNNPEFIDYVRNNKVSWQSLYELYDLYGEDKSIWNKYISNNMDNINLKGLLNTLKNINIDSLEENISSIQKAVSIIEELTTKKEEEQVKENKEDINKIYGE